MFSLLGLQPDVVEYIRIIDALEDCGASWNEVRLGLEFLLFLWEALESYEAVCHFLSAKRADAKHGIFTASSLVLLTNTGSMHQRKPCYPASRTAGAVLSKTASL